MSECYATSPHAQCKLISPLFLRTEFLNLSRVNNRQLVDCDLLSCVLWADYKSFGGKYRPLGGGCKVLTPVPSVGVVHDNLLFRPCGHYDGPQVYM